MSSQAGEAHSIAKRAKGKGLLKGPGVPRHSSQERAVFVLKVSGRFEVLRCAEVGPWSGDGRSRYSLDGHDHLAPAALAAVASCQEGGHPEAG